MIMDDRLEKWLYEESVAQIKGWDFSHIEGRYKEYPLPWEYRSIIGKYLKYKDKLLDIDTGGGEFLMSLGHPAHLTYATEGYAPNVELCKNIFAEKGINFTEMTDCSSMPFPDDSFDIIINRHGTYDAKEIYRTLKKGGVFITQQVGGDNDREFVELLLPECRKQFCGHNLENQVGIFEKCGFEILEKDEAFIPMEFYDTGALVWFAKIISWEFVGFSVENCLEALKRTDDIIRRDEKVSAYAHRFYFVAKK